MTACHARRPDLLLLSARGGRGRAAADPHPGRGPRLSPSPPRWSPWTGPTAWPCAIPSTGRSVSTDPHGPRSPRAACAPAPTAMNAQHPALNPHRHAVYRASGALRPGRGRGDPRREVSGREVERSLRRASARLGEREGFPRGRARQPRRRIPPCSDSTATTIPSPRPAARCWNCSASIAARSGTRWPTTGPGAAPTARPRRTGVRGGLGEDEREGAGESVLRSRPARPSSSTRTEGASS